MSPVSEGPRLGLYDRQGQVNLDIDYVGEAVKRAIPLCVEQAVNESPLLGLEQLEVSVVSESEISEVHGRFLNDPTATDVITFDHGEIIVSADMAQEKASGLGHPTEAELLLYVIHGLLHLGGYNDKSESEFEEMSQIQERIWEETR
jgi:probable rRNA maturation factor